MLNNEGAMTLNVPSLSSVRKPTALDVRSQLHYPKKQGIKSIQLPFYPHLTYAHVITASFFKYQTYRPSIAPRNGDLGRHQVPWHLPASILYLGHHERRGYRNTGGILAA